MSNPVLCVWRQDVRVTDSHTDLKTIHFRMADLFWCHEYEISEEYGVYRFSTSVCLLQDRTVLSHLQGGKVVNWRSVCLTVDPVASERPQGCEYHIDSIDHFVELVADIGRASVTKQQGTWLSNREFVYVGAMIDDNSKTIHLVLMVQNGKRVNTAGLKDAVWLDFKETEELNNLDKLSKCVVDHLIQWS